jgi:hypothetical protein
MGYFDLKVECSVCENDCGLNRNKTKHGWVCNKCQKVLSKHNINLFNIKKYSVEELKNIIHTVNKTASDTNQRIQDNQNNAVACCKKCGSTSLSANKKGFGLTKGAVGIAVAGPIGILAAGKGKNKIKITCLNCGNKFKPGK